MQLAVRHSLCLTVASVSSFASLALYICLTAQEVRAGAAGYFRIAHSLLPFTGQLHAPLCRCPAVLKLCVLQLAHALGKLMGTATGDHACVDIWLVLMRALHAGHCNGHGCKHHPLLPPAAACSPAQTSLLHGHSTSPQHALLTCYGTVGKMRVGSWLQTYAHPLSHHPDGVTSAANHPQEGGHKTAHTQTGLQYTHITPTQQHSSRCNKTCPAHTHARCEQHWRTCPRCTSA
jgi:hypothetical protein